MTDDQKKELKMLCYVNWMLAQKFNDEHGVRDVGALENVVALPGGGSLTCFLGERLSNRKDLYSQLGWFVYYMVDGEPFISKNRSVAMLMLIWTLGYYRLEYDVESLADFITFLDTMKQGNSDISQWFSNNCR
jgi:hypothetical protein